MLLMASLSASAMTVEQSRNEAWFLTDKMAHELRLSSCQWDDVYEVNYDFFRSLSHVSSSITGLERTREQKLMYILTVSQWNEYRRISYFNTPVVASAGSWSLTVYNHYDRNRYFDRNHSIVYSYNGTYSNRVDHYYNRHGSSMGNTYANSSHNSSNYKGASNSGNHNSSGYNMGNNGNHKGNNMASNLGKTSNGSYASGSTLARRTPSNGVKSTVATSSRH